MSCNATRGAAVTVAALALVGTLALWQPAQADTPETIQIAIPTNVAVSAGQSHLIIIGRPTSISTIVCAPGTAYPQTAVLVDPGSGDAAEISGVLVFHDHELPAGSRYLITSGPSACSTDLRLYTATAF